MVDARAGGSKDNLTPRALVFPLGADCYLAYDVDLLRVACVWKANNLPFQGAGMAVNSYPYGGNKVGGGTAGPKPAGRAWLENGIYAGVGTSEPQFTDPRPKLPPEEKVVNGGIDPNHARFLGVEFSQRATIHYEIGGSVRIAERFSLEKEGLIRDLKIGSHREPLYIVVAKGASADQFSCHGPASLVTIEGHLVCCIDPSEKEEAVAIIFKEEMLPEPKRITVKKRRWPEAVTIPLPTVQNEHALNLEQIPLPLENPYGRGVRAAAVDFFTDGRAALVTFDGDVWLADGLRPGATEVTWTRFTSGLHEPLSIGIRDEEIFVFDRNGLWRLHDRDKNGEADYHEMFCSRIDQTSETREYASAMRLDKDGGFVICKPGQQKTFSSILRVSPDGKEVKLIAHGFRQPLLGYDPLTGQIAVSDQQGNWVPSTPVHFIEQGGFYGFPNGPADKDRAITPPLTWIPHQVCASSTSIVWTRDAKLGPLNDAPILLSYHQPKLLQIHPDIGEGVIQGGATALNLTLNAPLLNGAMNPADGLLYVAGFKIWGTGAREPTFLGRIRHNSDATWTIPTTVRAAKRGILLRFDVPLNEASLAGPDSFKIRRWNYQRSGSYGSAYYRLDGEKGTETLPVASAKLSRDGRSVFLGIPDMREVMQIEIGYNIAAQDGTPIRHQSYLTAHRLRSVNLTKQEFRDNQVDLDLKDVPLVERPTVEPTIERGAQYYTRLGCVGCHSVDGTNEGKNGPSWLGLYGSQRRLVKSDKSVRADEAYLRESILDPAAKVAQGAVNGEAGMPIYAGVLEEEQIDSLLLFMKALADKNSQAVALVSQIQPPSARTGRQWKVDDFHDELARPLRGRSFAAGKLAFLGGSCFSCHQVGQGKGGQLGPDLSKLDAKMRGLELLTHTIEPSRRIDDKFKARTITTVSGKIHSGFVVSENEKEVRLTEDPLSRRAPITIAKNEIEEVKLSEVSAMPKGALGGFDKQQVLDLLAYIESRGDPNHPVFRRGETKER